jgi:hypothetical protein
MICMWFTGTNYYNLAVEKDRDSIFTIVATIDQGWKKYRTTGPLVPENFLSSQKIFPQERKKLS